MDKKSAAKNATGFAYAIVVWLVMLVICYPPILAAQLWDPLDNSLYWTGLGAGCALAGVMLGAPIPARWKGGWQLFGLLAPLWMVFFAVGANEWFDRSPAVPHASRYLGATHPSKGPGAFRFASWRRDRTEERLFGNSMLLAPALGRALGGADAGTPLVVTTHAGALGWEWIAGFERGE